MEVNLLSNPSNPAGLAVQFPYSEKAVEQIKLCLGLEWNPSHKLWISSGPEVLLDFERFNIKPGFISREAREIGEGFREQLWGSIQARNEPIYERLYGYQEQGSKFLANLPIALLGDDLGTGKSKQALDAAANIGAEKILILAPKTITYNWLDEVATWHPEYTAGVVPDVLSSNKKPHRRQFWREQPQIVIANYEKLMTSDWPYKQDWDVLICDEASTLKNSTTQKWKNVRRIAKNSSRFWCLTGTPLEIRIPELYNLFRLMRPAVLGNYMRFLSQHCVTDWAGNITGIKNLELLRDRISYWMLRRTKEEVLPFLPRKIPLPPKYIEMTAEEEDEYQTLRDEFEEFLINHEVGGTNDPMVQTLRMRQWCCSPAIFGIERRGSKYETLLELIRENSDKKIMVFCDFEKMISILSNWLVADVDYNPEALISGNVKAPDRIARVKAFNEGQLGQVFLSTDAGNQGINLTSVEICVHYSQIWNPMKMRQREDRAHRIGQENILEVVSLLYKNTIDEGMWLLNREREELFEAVVEGAEQQLIKRMNPERWRRVVAGKSIGK